MAHLQQMAIRRFGKAEILRGWQAWYDLWAKESRQRRILAAAAGRLSRPALVASLTHWRVDWEAMQLQVRAKPKPKPKPTPKPKRNPEPKPSLSRSPEPPYPGCA